jgi:hypothetical protein
MELSTGKVIELRELTTYDELMVTALIDISIADVANFGISNLLETALLAARLSKVSNVAINSIFDGDSKAKQQKLLKNRINQLSVKEWTEVWVHENPDSQKKEVVSQEPFLENNSDKEIQPDAGRIPTSGNGNEYRKNR